MSKIVQSRLPVDSGVVLWMKSPSNRSRSDSHIDIEWSKCYCISIGTFNGHFSLATKNGPAIDFMRYMWIPAIFQSFFSVINTILYC